MRVRIIARGGYSSRHGLRYDRGQIAEIADHVAVKLIRHGIAEPAPAPLVIESAVKAPPANAAKRVGKAAKATTEEVDEAPQRKGTE